MKSTTLSRRELIATTFMIALGGAASRASAQEIVTQRVLRQEKDALSVTLRLPQNSIVASQEAVLYLRIEALGSGGAKQPVPYARIEVKATLSNSSSPALFTAYPDGVAGEYSVVGKFPEPGEYTIAVSVTASGGEATAFSFSPVRVLSTSEKEKAQEAAYSLKVVMIPAQPLPGELVKMRFWVVDNATKKRVTEFESLYGSPLHLYVVREDIGDLRREKPIPVSAAPNSKEDGDFLLDYAFPNGGNWCLFAEFAPRDQGTQTVSARITIPGAKALPEPLMAQIAPLVRQNGINLRFAKPTRLIARETTSLALQLEDGQGNPLSDLQITDTMLAHLYFAERDGKTFLHTVPDSRDPRNGRSGSNVMSFPVRFPKAGTYRAWLAVNRSGQPAVVTFVVRVYDK